MPRCPLWFRVWAKHGGQPRALPGRSHRPAQQLPEKMTSAPLGSAFARGLALRAPHIFCHLILTTTCTIGTNCSHFTDEEPETQRKAFTCLCDRVTKPGFKAWQPAPPSLNSHPSDSATEMDHRAQPTSCRGPWIGEQRLKEEEAQVQDRLQPWTPAPQDSAARWTQEGVRPGPDLPLQL